jgi:rod shape-determining protein mreD
VRKVILWTVAAAFLLGVFETAILSHIRFLPALPDLILILVVYIALHNGTVAGITAGFFSGLIFDFLSLAPMGLHSFVFTALGFLYGILYRKYNVRRFFFPLILGLSATFLKAGILLVLHVLFGQGIQVYNLLAVSFWIEVVENALCAPLLFMLLGVFPNAFEIREL